MTTIAGIEHNGRVHMGGDSAVTDGGFNTIEIIDQPKVWVNNGTVWGGCGDVRYLQLAKYALKMPRLQAKHADSLDRWVTISLCNALRECWKPDVDLRPQEDKTPEVNFLLGVRGRLYFVGGDLAVVHIASGYQAIGSGGSIARGVLRATAGKRSKPKERIAQALTAASELTAFVRPPFHYVSA